MCLINELKMNNNILLRFLIINLKRLNFKN